MSPLLADMGATTNSNTNPDKNMGIFSRFWPDKETADLAEETFATKEDLAAKDAELSTAKTRIVQLEASVAEKDAEIVRLSALSAGNPTTVPDVKGDKMVDTKEEEPKHLKATNNIYKAAGGE